MIERFAIGIDIGGTRTKAGLVNIVTGSVLQSVIQSTEKTCASTFLVQIGKMIGAFRQTAEREGNAIDGIGFGIPGYTNENGEVITTYGFLEFMENYPLKKIIENDFLIACLVDNDARIVALGEATYGQGKGYNRVLTLTLGTGVGFGFVVNGKFSDATPLSHMGGNIAITNEGETCYCGKKGCLEALVSSTGIINLAKQSGAFATDRLTVESIFSQAQNGDAAAASVVEKVCSYLHTAIHNYVNLFAPDRIVLGGGIAKALIPYLDKIKGQMYMGPYPGYDFRLTVSQLEEQSGILGSAALFHSLQQKLRVSV